MTGSFQRVQIRGIDLCWSGSAILKDFMICTIIEYLSRSGTCIHSAQANGQVDKFADRRGNTYSSIFKQDA